MLRSSSGSHFGKAALNSHRMKKSVTFEKKIRKKKRKEKISLICLSTEGESCSQVFVISTYIGQGG